MTARPRKTEWRVQAADPNTLGEIVARAGGDARAIADGRVFLGRVRASRADAGVQAGDLVTIHGGDADAAAEPDPIVVLARGTDFVAVQKDAGMVTIPDQHGAAQSLLMRAARTLGLDSSELHPTSRLDREVSGVVVFALAKSAADRLTRARAEHRYARRYVAIAAKAPSPDRGVWSGKIGRDGDPKKRRIDGRDATDAESRYAVVERQGVRALLALTPITGRTHQLRLHASHAGAPLLGDRMYGGPNRITLPGGRVLSLARIALHAARVTLPDETGADVTIESRIPADLREIWAALGGASGAWDTALDAPTGHSGGPGGA